MITLLLLLAVNFHTLPVREFATKPHTHVCTTGKVTLVKGEADGDIHFKVTDKTAFIVAEIIPAVPLPKPVVGTTVEVCGIRRYDDLHKWYEVHPVLKLTTLRTK